MATSYRDLELPDTRGVDGERGRQPQARVQRIAIDIWDPRQITPRTKNSAPESQNKNRKNIEICIRGGWKASAGRGRREPTEVGELRGAALELELVAGEGLEPVLERVLQRPRYDGLHPPPASPDGSPGAARRPDGSVVASRRIGGEIPARWGKRRGEGGGGGGTAGGCETRWWALLGLRLRLPFGLSFIFFFFN